MWHINCINFSPMSEICFMEGTFLLRASKEVEDEGFCYVRHWLRAKSRMMPLLCVWQWQCAIPTYNKENYKMEEEKLQETTWRKFQRGYIWPHVVFVNGWKFFFLFFTFCGHTVGSKSIQPPWLLPLTAIVNKLCNIVCCVYNSNISDHPKYDFFKV